MGTDRDRPHTSAVRSRSPQRNATFVPKAGFNKLWAGHRIEQKDNPRYTELSYEYLLGFDAR